MSLTRTVMVTSPTESLSKLLNSNQRFISLSQSVANQSITLTENPFSYFPQLLLYSRLFPVDGFSCFKQVRRRKGRCERSPMRHGLDLILPWFRVLNSSIEFVEIS